MDAHFSVKRARDSSGSCGVSFDHDRSQAVATREGAVWYCPRSSAEPGVGVLYPDVSRIRTLAAYYHDYDAIASRKALREKPQRQAAVK